MVKWFWQRDDAPRRTLALRSRGDQGDATRIDFAELAPELNRFLGQAAYLQLGYFETLTRLIRATPELLREGVALARRRSRSDQAPRNRRPHRRARGTTRRS